MKFTYPAIYASAAFVLISAVLVGQSRAHVVTQTASGNRLSIDTTRGPAKAKASVRISDETLAFSHDPTKEGASLSFISQTPAAGRAPVITLPALHWNGVGSPPGSKGWKYRDPTGSSGGVIKATVKQTAAKTKINIKAKGPLWPWSPAAAAGAVYMRVSIGGDTACALFGGKVTADQVQRFRAKRAPRPASCVPICGDGRHETGESCDDGNLDDTDACSNDCLCSAPGCPRLGDVLPRNISTVLANYENYTPAMISGAATFYPQQLFSRQSDAVFRAQFAGPDTIQGLYVNFIEITDTERAQWQSQGIEAFVAKKGNQDYRIGGGVKAVLARFWDPAWQAFRISHMPDVQTGLADLNVDFLFLDVMNLFPTTRFISTLGVPAELGSNAAWRQAMLDLTANVRAALPPDIVLLANCIRATNQGAQFDGTDMVGTGLADTGLIEMKIDFNAVESSKLISHLVSIRASIDEGKPVSVTAKLIGPDDIQLQIDYRSVLGLIEDSGLLLMSFGISSEFASNPPPYSPLLTEDFGAPVDPAFNLSVTPSTIISRSFANGWTVLFNPTMAALSVPFEFRNLDVVGIEGSGVIAGDGLPQSHLTRTPYTNQLVQPFHAMILRSPQA